MEKSLPTPEELRRAFEEEDMDVLAGLSQSDILAMASGSDVPYQVEEALKKAEKPVRKKP